MLHIILEFQILARHVWISTPATVICAPAVPEPSVAVGVAKLLSAQSLPVEDTQDHSNALAIGNMISDVFTRKYWIIKGKMTSTHGNCT